METQEKMDTRASVYKAITPGPAIVAEKELYKTRLAARLKAASAVVSEKRQRLKKK